MAEQSSDPAVREGATIRGRHIPRRRFTRWALYYFVIYLVVPVLAVGLAVDMLLYLLTPRVFERCYALFCVFQ